MAAFCQDQTEIAQTLAKIRHVDAKGRGRRLEAAVGFGGLKVKEALSLLGMSESTYRRTVRGTRTLTSQEAATVAEHVKLPVEFFDMDFWAAAEAPDGNALSQLQADVEALRERVRQTEMRLETLAVEARQRREEDVHARTDRPPPSQPT